MQKAYIVLLLLPLIALSGCVDLSGIFGGDVLNVQQKVVQSGQRDILLVKDAFIIPKSPLLPDTPVTLSLILANQDNLRSAENTQVVLFDAPTFKNSAGALCNSVPNGCLPEDNKCSSLAACTILAGEEKLVSFDLTAPSESEIAGIKTDTALSYKVDYDTNASLIYTVPVINYDEVVKLQRANKKASVEISKAVGPGPMQIDVELQGGQYILAGQATTLAFTIKNVGSGMVNGSKIQCGKPDPDVMQTITQLITSIPLHLSANPQYPGAAFAQSTCSDSAGHPGYCIDTASTCLGTIISSGTSCMNPLVWCCVTQQPNIGAYCTDGSRRGACKDINVAGSCPNGEFVSGLCLGANQPYPNVKCCLPLAQTNTVTNPTNPTTQTQNVNPCSGTGSFIIKFPAGVNLTDWPPGRALTTADLFSCVGSVDAGWTCQTVKPIDIFNDESKISMLFRAKIGVDRLDNAPFKSFTITAKAQYTYELRNSLSVTVNTFQNV